MLTLAEALVVVTAAGVLLGKKEISAGARMLGVGVGRVVGMLQGARVKYEERTRGTELYELHRSVKRGLEDMGTIGSDLVSIRTGNVNQAAPSPPLPMIQKPAVAGHFPHPHPLFARGTVTSSPVSQKENTGLRVFENGLEIDELKFLIQAEEEKRKGRSQ